MRRKIVAGNWKMNLSLNEAVLLHKDIEQFTSTNQSDCSVYQFAPSIYLTELLATKKNVTIGAQNGFPKENGAFTGEVSMHQLAQLGVEAVLVGHSERRQIFHESDAFLKEKVDAALNENLEVFFCCGETLEQRENGSQEETILNQLKNSLFHIAAEQFSSIVIAYEPIWAIGTGKTATPEQANAMHQFIRRSVEQKYNAEIASNLSILYGGSCKPSNAANLFSESAIDGGLIGGAALKSNDFQAIISTFYKS